MGANRYEREVRRLLEEDGASLRTTTNGHEMWTLSNGRKFACGAGHSSDHRAWRNSLSDLRQLLDPKTQTQGEAS